MSATFTQRTDFLGFGLTRPFRRFGSDFVAEGGEALIRSSLRGILNTRPGEIPWRPSFGVDLDRSRYKLLSDEFKELARHLVEDAIRSFEPRVTIQELTVTSEDTTLRIRLVWAIINTTTPENQVILGPVTQEVTV